MKNRGAAGARRERDVRQYFRQRGWEAVKVSDSAVCDVVAMKRWNVLDGAWMARGPLVYMLEVKATKGGPYERFQPKHRRALSEAAKRAGAVAMLAYWPPNGELQLIPEDDWPEARGDVAA